MNSTNGEDWALLLVKSTNKFLSSTAISMLGYTPCRLQLVKPASRAVESNDPSSKKMGNNSTHHRHRQPLIVIYNQGKQTIDHS